MEHTEQLLREIRGALDQLSRTEQAERDSSRGSVARSFAARFSGVTDRSTLRDAARESLALYLDTVLLLGSIAATHGAQAWLFVVGAAVGSTLWFMALGFGARGLGQVLSSALAWRVLDGVVAVTMVGWRGVLAKG